MREKKGGPAFAGPLRFASPALLAPLGSVADPSLADERVQKEDIGDFQRALLDILVCPVNGISGLKSDNGSPLPLSKDRARLRGLSVVGAKARRCQILKHLDLSSHQHVRAAVKCGDSRMRLFFRAVDAPSLNPLIYREYIAQAHNRHGVALRGAERHLAGAPQPPRVLLAHRAANGQGPWPSGREVHALKDFRIVVMPHEASDGVKAPIDIM